MKRIIFVLLLSFSFMFADRGLTGDKITQFTIAQSYEKGDGVVQDFSKAAKWYKKSSEQGYDKSQYYLGVYYYEGKGVIKDYTQSAFWIEKSMKQDNIQAKKFWKIHNLSKYK